MTGPDGARGQALALLLLAAVAAAAWQAIATPLLDTYASQAATIAQRQALARRMAQVAASVPALRAQAAAPLEAAAAPSLIPGATDAVAGATLQQTIQDLARQSGATLASSETLPAEAQGAFRRVAVRVSVSTPWPSLVRLFQAIAEASPGMLIDDVQLHGIRMPGSAAAVPLDASLTVFGFRAP